ncbi:MAG: DNA topoisomerase I [Omnitrophica WOR_2 bacterium RIFCSPHIGHO2_02_FULL_68_15]|nr:MAG: DNA topoisomerase I [Omnitrophica WOR_2 bacterium RIFCSPHIGHO2_02_FULL_68_15]
MAKRLVIVESPAKAKTINKILGPDFDVTSSMGHLRDLPASRLGVDVEHDFAPHYIVIQKRRKFAKQLQEAARGREAVYLAPDPDREGEAISWHLERLLLDDDEAEAKKAAKRSAGKSGKEKPASPKGKKAAAGRNGRKIYRITFHEITPDAIKAAVQHPRPIDLKKVNAQQARRVLDRLVGYSLSPLLWKKVGRGLSAGRVQSVALRLTVDREKEIEAFKPQEYWTIEAELQKAAGGGAFKAQLEKIGDKKAEVKTKADAERIAEELRRQSFAVGKVDEKEQRRYPKPPFTTSTLQQEAFHKLNFSSARTMRIAQELYEGLEIGEAAPVGLITYMRTDSVRVANEALAAVRSFIPKRFGKDYLPAEPRAYRSRKSAQEAHEAVRPTSVSRAPESLKGRLNNDQLALYQLVWQRFVASQMADAVDRVIGVQVDAGPAAKSGSGGASKFHLKANGRTNIFPGWTQAYQEAGEEPDKDEDRLPDGTLPPLVAGEKLTLAGVTPSQHFTKPPRRYTDASLVKALEENGIGRPSTYAPTIQTIVGRDYVRRQGGSLVPTQLGRTVTEMLVEHFPEIMDIKFTAEMEEELDRIEEGHLEWISVIRQFYAPFASRVTTAQEKMRDVKREVIPTDYVCEKCGKPMVIKWGRFGQFLSCSAYPECRNAKPVPTGVACPQPGCGGDLIERRSRGRHFYGCSNYPTCRYTARRLEKDAAGADEKDASDEGDESKQ